MSTYPQLVLRQDPHKVAPLDPGAPLTIGRARTNKLCLASWEAVAPHHAVVRFSPEHGWLVCDWGSPLGTYCRGRRVQRCLPLRDGDDIALGREGPVLVFQHRSDVIAVPVSATPASATDALPAPPVDSAAALASASAAAIPSPASPRAPSAPPAPPSSAIAGPARRAQGSGAPAAAKPLARRAPIQIAGREVPPATIRSADVRSRPRHPHSFSWWVLACLAGLVLLPWAWLFWPWQIGALAAWILLGARKEHVLILTLRDGMAYRHRFVNRSTALAHRNGVRRAIGQPLDS